MDRTHLRAGEIGDLLGVSERTVRRWIADQILRSVKIGGARLVPIEELERLQGDDAQPSHRQEENEDEPDA